MRFVDKNLMTFSEFKGEKPHRVGIGIDEEF